MPDNQLVFKDWDKFVARHDPQIVRLAFNRTITASLKKTRTQISVNVRKVYNIKAREIASTVRLKRYSFDPPQYALIYSGYRISIRHYAGRAKRVMSARGWRKGFTVKVRKDRGRKLIRGGFYARGWPVYLRINRDDPKSKIQKHSGLAIPQMVQTKDQLALAYDFMTKEAALQWPVQMDYYVKKNGGVN